MTDIKSLIKEPLTNHEIYEFVPATRNKLIEYNELAQYNDIEDLLTHDKDFRIILIEYTNNSGHWIVVLRYGDTIELFNSFGKRDIKSNFVNDPQMNKMLGQASLHLHRLLINEKKEKKFRILYNNKKLQRESHSVNTCGRHVLSRIICLLELNMNLEEYLKFMKRSKDKYKLKDYDEVVTVLIH